MEFMGYAPAHYLYILFSVKQYLSIGYINGQTELTDKELFEIPETCDESSKVMYPETISFAVNNLRPLLTHWELTLKLMESSF